MHPELRHLQGKAGSAYLHTLRFGRVQVGARARARGCTYATYAAPKSPANPGVGEGVLHTARYESYESPANANLSTGSANRDFTRASEGHVEPVAHVCAEDLAAYREARRKAVLAVVEALFDEVFEQPEDEWGLRAGEVLRECKQTGAPFEVAWAIVCDRYPPPTSWLPYSLRERVALAGRGYVPDGSRRGKKGDEGVFAFTYRVLRDAYEV